MGAETQETFVEEISRFSVPDMDAFFTLGRNICERVAECHTIYRLRFSARHCAVERELCATFHGRIGAISIDENGARLFTVIGIGDKPFSFDIAERDFWNTRKFTTAIYSHAGVTPFIVPGKIRATMRAIWELSKDGEQ